MGNTPSVQNLFKQPLLERDSKGNITQNITRPWLRWFQDVELKTRAVIDVLGQIDPGAIDFALPYLNKTLENIPDGVTRAAVSPTALTAGDVDLGKAGVVGELGSAKLVRNVTTNTTNNCVVDSLVGASSAVVRVYGPGGPGTTWNQFVGGVKSADFSAFVGSAPFSTQVFVYFDGANFQVTTNAFQTMPDGLIFCGTCRTVAPNGTGAIGGGGTPTGVGLTGGRSLIL